MDLLNKLRPQSIKFQLYIGDENASSDQIDFKKALDLLEYHRPTSTVTDGTTEELRLRIWARAVPKDDWTKLDVDNPVEAVQETTFFKLLEFCFLQVILEGSKVIQLPI